MKYNDVWVLWCKAKILPGCSIAMDGSEYLYVTCFAPSDSINLAIELTHTSLQENTLEFAGISKCMQYRTNPWDADNREHRDIIGLAEKALEEQKVICSAFISQEIMEETGLAW